MDKNNAIQFYRILEERYGFTQVLPSGGASVVLLVKNSWPPLSVNVFAAGVALAGNIFLLAFPDGDGFGDFMKYYLFVSHAMARARQF